MLWQPTSQINKHVKTLHGQVKTVGLRVLKSTAQKEIAEGPHRKSHQFSMFLVGEFFGDVFLLIQQTLKVTWFNLSLIKYSIYRQSIFCIAGKD